MIVSINQCIEQQTALLQYTRDSVCSIGSLHFTGFTVLLFAFKTIFSIRTAKAKIRKGNRS